MEVHETVVSKLNALMGGSHARFGIPFTGIDTLITTCDGLRDAGYQCMGREQLYSGVTGEPLDGPSFVGCVLYQRLRHMVIDKTVHHWHPMLCERDACTKPGPGEPDGAPGMLRPAHPTPRDSQRRAAHAKAVCASVKWNAARHRCDHRRCLLRIA